jgi:hypothetical protein
MKSFHLLSLLHLNSLTLFVWGHKGFPTGKNTIEEIKIDFPEDVVSNSDIFDADKFAFALKNELIRRPELKGSEILFLIPEEKIFSKFVELTNTTIEAEKGRFFTHAPVSEEESYLNIQTQGDWVLFSAVPKKLVTDIENSLAKVGFKSSFLPLSQLVSLGFGGKRRQLVGYRLQDHINLVVSQFDLVVRSLEVDLSKKDEDKVVEEIKKMRDEEGLGDIKGIILLNEEASLAKKLEEAGLEVGLVTETQGLFSTLFKILHESKKEIPRFLVGQPVKIKTRKVKFPLKKFLSLIGIIGLLFLLLGLFIFFKDLGSKFGTEHQSPLVSTPTMTPTPTTVATQSAQLQASPSASLVAKSDLKLMVINGNGLPGDAGRLAKVLNGLGYTNSETDTADTQGQRVTSIQVSGRVPVSYLQELKTAVEDEYVQVTVSTVENSPTDIEITTGTRG